MNGFTALSLKIAAAILGITFAAGLAHGRLFYSDTKGTVYVLKAGPEYQLIAKNEMKEHLKSALAPSDDQLFIRTYKNLYCVGKRRKSP